MPTKTYFSTAGALIVNVSVGQRIIENGQSKVINQKVAEFNRQPDGYGRLDTTDPETIDVLERRITDHGDVFDYVEYCRRTTPLDIQLREEQNKYTRLLEEHNRLAKKLQVDGKLPAEKPASK